MFFNLFIMFLRNVLSQFFIVKDFNIDLLKYECCNYSDNFFNHLSSLGYMPLITKPTRITKSTATLIDNIFLKHGIIVASY